MEELRSDLPERQYDPRSEIRDMLLDHEGLWVLVNPNTAVCSGYKGMAWVKKDLAAGWKVEFVGRNKQVWGRMVRPEIPGQQELEI